MKKESKAIRNTLCSLIAVCILAGLAGMVLSHKSAGANSNGMVSLCSESPLDYIEVLY